MCKTEGALLAIVFFCCAAHAHEAIHQASTHQDALERESINFDQQIELSDQPEVLEKKSIDYSNWDSLTSRHAPPQHKNQNPTPYQITEERLKKIRKEFIYWYFDKGSDEGDNGDRLRDIHSSRPQTQKNLNFQLPFFGFRYDYARISLNGYLEFSDPPYHYPSYPLVFPVKNWPKEKDPSFIGIFLSKCRIGSLRPDDIDQREPGVYFRIERDLQKRTDQLGVEMRERVKWDLREGIVGANTFEPKHVIIVTWKNVSFAGGIDQSFTTTNTFQLVLSTDEVYTYAIYNYIDLQWTSHVEAMGDTLKGEGGVPAYIGFNAGNGSRSFEYMPFSQHFSIRDLSRTGWGNGFKGRHIFRIDENIIAGSCNIDNSIFMSISYIFSYSCLLLDRANIPLIVAPESGNMLGGTIINITGPCFEPGAKIVCTFDKNTEVHGIIVDRNRALCVQPRLFVEGYIRFEISLLPGRYKWKGKYFVETPATATEHIFFQHDSVHLKSPTELTIIWSYGNLTTNQNAGVRISLWGYREVGKTPEFLYIDELATDITNSGTHTLLPDSFRNRDNRNLLDIKFGFIQINLTESISVQGANTKITPVIWSKPIPLSWYFSWQWEKKFGQNWTTVLCNDWLRHDGYLKNFTHELPHCPCSLDQALNDKGRYMPDPDCDLNANPTCAYHMGALHCVQTGTSIKGAGQQCCYDRNQYLMLSHDQLWGSSPHRCHNLGYSPWNEATKVPTLSHWLHDIVPKYLCCRWNYEQSSGCRSLRTQRRPTQDCVGYQSPAVAGVFGDPHFLTFDDVLYTFNGKGEFVLVRSNNEHNKLDVQGRFEQMPANVYGDVRATQITSVVARENSSAIIEINLRPKQAQWRYRLDVVVDGKRIYFDKQPMKYQHFSGVTVYTPPYILNQSQVIVMFDSGAGLEVVENKGYMTARVYLPQSYINQTRGLLGSWNLNGLDEFTDPNGAQTSAPSNTAEYEKLYNEFGLKWMVNDKDVVEKGKSLFYTSFGRTPAYYNNETFKPEFKMVPEDMIFPNRSYDIFKAYDTCGDDSHCLYDYSLTLNRELAQFTLFYKNALMQLKEIGRKRIISCGVLETPKFGRKSTFLFTPGTRVVFECDEGYVLIGDVRRECLINGKWNVLMNGSTRCSSKRGTYPLDNNDNNWLFQPPWLAKKEKESRILTCTALSIKRSYWQTTMWESLNTLLPSPTTRGWKETVGELRPVMSTHLQRLPCILLSVVAKLVVQEGDDVNT
ncbi:hypothetical protein FQR65_LT10111 [Abscondita terminalis]|nr:hypothetical protein FQR65_LT10111 [Abscondita terminalis]